MRVIFSCDDGSYEDLRLAELLAKYDIPAIFYIPSEWQTYNIMEGREPLSLEDALDIASHFEIGSHGISHRMLTRIPETEAEREIIQSKKTLEILFNRPIDSFCYPRGYANDYLRDVVRDHYKSARNTLVGNILPSEDPVWETPTVHVAGKRRPEYEGKHWLNEAKKLLDLAVKTEGSVYHMWGHSWEISRYDGWHDLESLLKEVRGMAE